MSTQPERPESGRPGRGGRGARRRDEILEAVNRLLVEWGSVERLTVRAVAQEAGISAPSIYLHFSDKTEMVWAALADKYRELAVRMSAAADAVDGGDPRERLRAEMHAYCDFALGAPGQYRLMYEMRQPAVDVFRIRRHPAALVSDRLREAVAGCRGDYALSLPVEQLAQTLWAALHGQVSLASSLFSGGSTSELLRDLADGLLESTVRTSGAPHEGSPGPDEETAAVRALREVLGTAGTEGGTAG